MKKLRVGVVGLGHRGREMLKLASVFDCVEPAAACDILPRNWYEKQWLSDAPMAELLPDTVFYEDYDKMLEEANLEGSNILKITHEKIANHMGTAREVVTRMLRYFQGEGMVKLTRGAVEITDETALEQLQDS